MSFQLQGEGTETSVPFEARLVDSPGWGDLMSLERSFGLVTRTLDTKYRTTLRAETRLDRGSTRSPILVPFEGGQHVDVVLYCFNPHRCKGVDMAAAQPSRRRSSTRKHTTGSRLRPCHSDTCLAHKAGTRRCRCQVPRCLAGRRQP